VAWSGVGVNLATNEPTPEALRAAVCTVLDRPAYRMRASQMADEFARIDTRSQVLSIIKQAVVNQKLGLLAETMAKSGAQRALRQR
jgi:UDP:flavonoid glycosyltransferase YjiC (YdhE family)